MLRDRPLPLDPSLGFHFYGADLCLEARRRGLAVAALDAICFHHSRGIGLPPDFWPSAEAFKAKWAHQLPIATPCVYIDPAGNMRWS